MKVNNLVTYIGAVSDFLTKGSKGLKIIDNIISFIRFLAPLDLHFSNVGIVGLHIRPWSTMDMLRAVSK